MVLQLNSSEKCFTIQLFFPGVANLEFLSTQLLPSKFLGEDDNAKRIKDAMSSDKALSYTL